jgi:hypothetical protein
METKTNDASQAESAMQFLLQIEVCFCIRIFFTCDEVRKLMLDREAWRSRIKLIVAVNKEVDSSKREDKKIKCIKTRSATVAI